MSTRDGTHPTERARSVAIGVACGVLAAMVGGCGGGSGGAVVPAVTTGVTTPVVTVPVVTPPVVASPIVTIYPGSVVLGLTGVRSVSYTDGDSTQSPTVTTTEASAMLRSGVTTVIAEHREATLPGLDIVCVSGNGESTNVVNQINLGVIAESAAVLFSSSWSAIDPASAWVRAVASGAAWSGWENCGVKPEGLPSRSSQLVPTPDRGYTEDVFNGNPSTTFLAIRRIVLPSSVSAMLSDAGELNTDDPSRPLVLKLRAYGDQAGHTVFVQTGLPAAGAPAGVRGFIALYVQN